MIPELAEIIENGPSRHRLRKGLLLIARDARREPEPHEQSRVVTAANRLLEGHTELNNFFVEAGVEHPSLLTIVTPLIAIHNPRRRDEFFDRLAKVIQMTLQAAEGIGFYVMGTGVNPLYVLSVEQPTVLCSDIHEIEVLDDLEVNRIYNMFRQYLPELTAISSNSALYGGRLQKDLSTRQRINPASFTPPSLPLFSSKQMNRLERDMRKNYGVGNLAQLDIDLTQPGLIRLRFVDSQSSLRYIRSQVLLFQAVAINGRSLARQGSQMPILHSRTIRENKALAIEGGPAAILRPDRKREIRRPRPWYQDRQEPARASSALLQAIRLHTVQDGETILQAFRSLKAQFEELEPWLLGAELRQRDQACLVNYAEYQVRLYHIAPRDWPRQLEQGIRRMVADPQIDLVSEYNLSKHSELAAAIRQEWVQKLGSKRGQSR